MKRIKKIQLQTRLFGVRNEEIFFTQKRGYIQPTVRTVFKDLTREPSDSKDFKSATKFISCCLEKLKKGEFDVEENCCKNKYLVMGTGPQKSFSSTICSI